MGVFSSGNACDARCNGWLVGIFVFILASVVSAFIIIYLDEIRVQNKQNTIKSIAHENIVRLHRHIDQIAALSYPIAATVQKDGHINDFPFAAEQILRQFPLISRIALAPEGIIRHVVPLSGNEKAIGLNLMIDPSQRSESLLARKTGKLTLAGPLRMIQGDEGLVARLPLFRGDNTFWGFALVVIRFPDILHASALEDLSTSGLNYTLTRIHPDSKKTQLIAASSAEPLDRPVETRIELPNADWTLQIAPADGWHDTSVLAFHTALALFISLLLGYIAKQYTALRHYRDILESRVQERVVEVTKTQSLLHLLLDTVPDLIWLKDKEGKYLLCNPMFERFFGAKEEEIFGKSDYDFVDAEQADFFREKDRHALETRDSCINEEWITFADNGHQALMETVKTPVIDETGELVGILGIARDITERHTNEVRIQQLTHLYAALSRCNKAIVRAVTPEILFAEVCRGIVSEGGISMAWIGLIDPSTGLVRPSASYGDTLEYLEGIEISIREDDPSGKGPTGISIRENRPYWCQDFIHDPVTAPWHERAKTAGWKASAALPFHLYGKVIGAFMVYSVNLHAFDAESQELLVEMAMDISFAMENFDREAKRRENEEQLIKTEKLLEEMSEAAQIGGWEFDPETGAGSWTPETARIHDMEPDTEATAQIGLSVYRGEWLEKIQAAIGDAINEAAPYDLELQMTTPMGNLKWVRTIGIPVMEGGKVVRLRGSIQDITAQKTTEEKVHWLAHFDPLTGLPNRILLNDRLNHAIHIAHRNQTSVALLYLDLDHFKNINDSLGHDIGDQLLIQVSQRIQSIMRESDTLSRQGGDEFIILLSGTDAHGAVHVAEKLIETLSHPYQIGEHELSVTTSIGIALYPIDGDTLTALSQAADAAMYRAKHDGRNRYCFFAPEIQARSARNLELENALRNALNRNELEIYYQPQISVAEGKLIGAEALLRWNHPKLGMVSPDEFIPIAEESGLIVGIGEWVLRNALTQLRRWMEQGIEPFIMAVNLSAIQFRDPKLVSQVLAILEELQLPPEYLELELTERIASDNPLQAIDIMDTLHRSGIRMSIDDFGTGYSSLSYLKRFRVYKLKIDRSFIRDVTENPEDKTIVTAIISMAHSLKMVTIAEGVETHEQLDFLRENQCDEIQGYLYSRPVPSEAFEHFIHQLPQ